MSFNEVEQLFIGALLKNPTAYFETADVVNLADFRDETAMIAYAAIAEMHKDASKINLQSVVLRAGIKYAVWLNEAEDCGISANAGNLATIIAEGARKRRIRLEIQALLDRYNSQGSKETLEDVYRLFQAEAVSEKKKHDIGSVLDRFDNGVEENKKRGYVGFNTHITKLENMWVEYRPGEMWCIGAWTSVGKSAVMVELVARLLRHESEYRPVGVAVFSTEMKESRNVSRILANLTGVSSNLIEKGRVEDGGLSGARKFLKGKNLFIFDDVRDIDDIRINIQRLKMRGRCDVVFVDFIQNLKKKGAKSRRDMFADIAIDIQNMAHEMDVCIVCLSQIPNSAGKKDEGILEFKEAGEIAAACDIGILMKRAKEDPRVLLLDVRKNRHGSLGEFMLQFRENYTGLEEI